MIETAAISGGAALVARHGTQGADAQVFRRDLDAALTAGGDDDALREAARQLVSTALVQPLLAARHESPFAEGPFAPGTAERRFAPLLDQQLADRITSGAGFDLVDVIVDRLRKGGTT